MWLSRDNIQPLTLTGDRPHRVVVGVPARDEEATIVACIAALDRAAARFAAPVTIVVGANNCSDGTAAAVRGFHPRAAAIVVDEVVLPPHLAHAGGARRDVMDRAAALAGPGGMVMTTDADSRVDVDWIVANVGELAAGADAVAGMITFDADTRAALPDIPFRALEWRLASLQARLEHLVDPRPHDPWPRHIWAWGASMALTFEAYRAVGGVPLVALAEDRALADAVERAGLRLRRSHAPLVFTSARRSGRAPGGFADLLDSYANDATAPCDAAIEPTRTLLRRLVMRSRLRATCTGASFGTEWAAIEAATPALARRRVLPAGLVGEIALAERLIAMLERREARRVDSSTDVLAA